MHEFFDHTADLGFRIRSESWTGLLEEAGQCLVAAMIEDPVTIRPDREICFEITGADREYLLFDWLRELLFRTEADGMLFARFKVSESKTGLNCRAWGEPADRDRHQLSREVKAITYHGLRVTHTPSGWMAEVIVDI